LIARITGFRATGGKCAGVSQHDRRLPRRYVRTITYRFAGLYPEAGVQAEYEPPADAVVSLRMADGSEASLQLRHIQARRVLAAVPWRKTRSARGQAHYPGYFWSATMGGHVICPYRNRTSPYAGRHAGRWPFRVDPGDVSTIWFQDPADDQWHELRWEHADAVGGPFSSEALAYARQLATATHRFPDTRRALAELLEQWGAGLAGSRTERRMALRLSEQRLRLVPDPPSGTASPPEPAVIAASGDDDSDSELDAPFPAEESGDGPGDFYAHVSRKL
jgi:hypothetical protein